jgi:hypothetical protein
MRDCNVIGVAKPLGVLKLEGDDGIDGRVCDFEASLSCILIAVV